MNREGRDLVIDGVRLVVDQNIEQDVSGQQRFVVLADLSAPKYRGGGCPPIFVLWTAGDEDECHNGV